MERIMTFLSPQWLSTVFIIIIEEVVFENTNSSCRRVDHANYGYPPASDSPSEMIFNSTIRRQLFRWQPYTYRLGVFAPTKCLRGLFRCIYTPIHGLSLQTLFVKWMASRLMLLFRPSEHIGTQASCLVVRYHYLLVDSKSTADESLPNLPTGG